MTEMSLSETLEEEIKNFRTTVHESICSFGGNELGACNMNLADLDLTDDIESQRTAFLRQFTDYVPIKEARTHWKNILQKFEKKFEPTWSKQDHLAQFFNHEIDITKWILKTVTERISTPDLTTKYRSQLRQFQFSATEHLSHCEQALMYLSNAHEQLEPPLHYLKTALNHKYFQKISSFRTKCLTRTFRLFPLIRRKEILSITGNRLVDDLMEKWSPLPEVIRTYPELVTELERLANVLHIEFDIESHDGQKFTYLCEKQFFQMIGEPLGAIGTDVCSLVSDDPSIEERIEACFMESVVTNDIVKQTFENLIHPDPKCIASSLKTAGYSSAMIKELTRDKLLAYYRLILVRNVKLLMSIVESLKQQQDLKNKIDKENTAGDVLSQQFGMMRKHLLAVATIAVQENPRVNIERMFELLLTKEDEFQRAKLNVMGAFATILSNCHGKYDLKCFLSYAQMRPNLHEAIHPTFIAPFDLAIDQLKMISICMQSMITLEQLQTRSLGRLFGVNFPWFKFPGEGSDYRFDANCLGMSIFEVFPDFERLLVFLNESEEVSMEIMQSMAMRRFRYGGYVRFAVWKVLSDEIRKSLVLIDPQSYHFNIDPDVHVTNLMNSMLLNDMSYMNHNLKDNRTALKVLEFAELAWKLRQQMISIDLLLPIYHTQNQENGTQELSEYTKKLSFVEHKTNLDEIGANWKKDQLQTMVIEQNCFKLVLMIATRFNNFKSDALFINSFFEINSDTTVFQLTKSAVSEHVRQKYLRKAADALFYETVIFKSSDYSALFCGLDNIHAQWTDTARLSEMFIPFEIRSELAVLSCVERCFLKHYVATDVFVLSDGSSGSLIDNNDKISHFFVGKMSESLAIVRSRDVLKDLLEFVAVRLLLLHYVRLDSYLSHGKLKFFDSIYKEEMVWNATLFAKINSDLIRLNDSANLPCALSVFKDNLRVCSARNETVICDFIVAACDEGSRVSPEPLKKYWLSIKRELVGHSRYISTYAHIPKYLNQFFFMLDDTYKSELLNQLSLLELKVGEALLSQQSDNVISQSAEFSTKMLVTTYMKLAFYQILAGESPLSLTMEKAVLNVNNDILTKMRKRFETEISLGALLFLTGSERSAQVEIVVNKGMFQKLVDTMGEYWQREKEREMMQLIETRSQNLAQVFHAPNSQFKPDCYQKRRARGAKLPLLIVPKEADQQFLSEVTFIRTRCCTIAYESIKSVSKKDDQTVTIPVSELMNKLHQLNVLLYEYEPASRKRMTRIWGGCLEVNIKKWQMLCDQDMEANMFVKVYLQRYERMLMFGLVMRRRNDFLKLAALRDTESQIQHEHERFEKEVSAKIRAEFDLLVHDLGVEIKKAQAKFVYNHQLYCDAAKKAIGTVLNDEERIKNCMLAPVEPVKPEPEPEPLEPFPKPVTEPKTAPGSIPKSARRSMITQCASLLPEEMQLAVSKKKKRRIRIRRVESLSERVRLPNASVTRRRQSTFTGTGQTSISSSSSTKSIFDMTCKERQMMNQPKVRVRQVKVKTKEEEEKDAITKRVEESIKEVIAQNSQPQEENREPKDVIARMDKLRKEIAELDVVRKKLRIATTLSGLAVRRLYTREIAKAADDRKNLSACLWNGRRAFEEEMRELETDLHDAFQQVSKLELETETLTSELDEARKETTKLMHWKEVCLKTCDNLQKQLSKLEHVGDVNVTRLLQRISAGQDELARLTEETDELEEEITYEVREPQMEVDRARRLVARARINQMEAEKRMKRANQDFQEASQAANRIEHMMNENDRLTRENVILKNKIEGFEAQIAEMKPSQLERLYKVLGEGRKFDITPRKRFVLP